MEREKVLNNLSEVVSESLKGLVKKGELSPTELQNAKEAVCLMEKIEKLKMGSFEEPEDGYSMGYSANRSYAYMPDPYINSYRRGRSPYTGRYVSRDYMPRDHYSMDYNDHMSRDRYDVGYSGHSIADRAVDRLESMMDEAKTEYERDMVKRFIALIRNEQ